MTDIILHIDLNNPIDPASPLAIIRKEFRDNLVIYCRPPVTPAEDNYIKLFEEFHPIIKNSDPVAPLLLISGCEIDYPRIPYSLADLDIPTGPFLPVTGDFLQGLCDYTISTRDTDIAYGEHIYNTHSRERYFFIEDPLPPEIFQATSLYISPSFEGIIARKVFEHSWPNLRLIVFHNSDYPVDYRGVVPFLEANPNVWCWAENAIEWHPRIKVVPIGEQNRMWRGGNAEYDPTVTLSRNTVRDIDILVPYWRDFTNMSIRPLWKEQALKRTDVVILPEMKLEEYLENVSRARALVCPPGNGLDTHRHWDALRQGAWAVVEDNDHTRYMMQSYPSLHLIPVDDMMSPITIPEGLPPFHPVMLRAYWETLFRSHMPLTRATATRL